MTNNIQFSSVCGIDIAKSVMQVYKVTSDGVVSNKAVKRADFLNEFRNIPPALIGMEACGGSQHWARELQSLGHTVHLMPPKLVKPYVTGLKNDKNDARGIYKALEMSVREVPVKSAAIRDLALLQTMRTKRQREKIAKINHIRGILTEYGLVMGKSINAFLAKAGSLIVQLKERADVSPYIVSELTALFREVKEAMEKIKELETNIDSIAKTLKQYDLFRSAPGVGPITAATMLVLLCNPAVFKNGREFVAYIGLAPKSSGSGGKNFVTHIPKKCECNNDVRALLVQCAHSICRCKHKSDWVSSILARKPKKVAIIAIANKLARQLWIMAKKGEKFEKRFILAAV